MLKAIIIALPLAVVALPAAAWESPPMRGYGFYDQEDARRAAERERRHEHHREMRDHERWCWYHPGACR